MRQDWFEFRDAYALQRRTWIPLRQSTEQRDKPDVPGVVDVYEYVGRSTAAIPIEQRARAGELDWNDLHDGGDAPDVSKDHYFPADSVRSRDGRDTIGVKLVVDQYLEGDGTRVWHLHHDLVVALGLLRQDDTWFRPEEGWAEVARLRRGENGDPVLLEIRPEFLSDYLVARQMALYVSSYLERRATVTETPEFSWLPDGYTLQEGRDSRQGGLYTNEFAPEGERDQVFGQLWRTEWFEPGELSVRVRRDADPAETTFVADATGVRRTAGDLRDGIAYLHFKPELALALANYRGHTLGWFSRDTGSIGATGTGIHFGLNSLGLINVFAKDISDFDGWEQRLWSGFNVTPEGGVSAELLKAQMDADPAATEAPEQALRQVMEDFELALGRRLAGAPLRHNDAVPKLMARAHRFRGAEHDGVLGLAKDLARLFIERLDVDVVCAPLKLAKGDKPGSLKALERLLMLDLAEADARAMMAPFFGIYDLRLVDAHLGGGDRVAGGLERAGVDASQPAVIQARQLLEGFVGALRAITAHFPKSTACV